MLTQTRTLGRQSDVLEPLQTLETFPTLLAIKPSIFSLLFSHFAFKIEAHKGIFLSLSVDILIP